MERLEKMNSAGRQKIIVIVLFYVFLSLLISSVSFFSRKMDVKTAAQMQAQIWTEYTDINSKEAETPGYSVVKANLTRIFFPALMVFVSKLTGLPYDYAFSLLRIASIFLFFLIFHFYMREWGDEKTAFTGTLFVAATVPLTFNIYYEIPTEFFEMIFFTVGIWAIYKEKIGLLIITTFLATLSRETSAFLPLIYFFNVVKLDDLKENRGKLLKNLSLVFVVGLMWLLPYVFLRWFSGLGAEWNHQDSVSHNLKGLSQFFQNFNLFNNFLFYLYLFGIFWVLPFLYWKNLSLFWKKTLAATPFIVAVFLFGGGFMNEPRELVLLYPVIVPPALAALFGEKI